MNTYTNRIQIILLTEETFLQRIEFKDRKGTYNFSEKFIPKHPSKTTESRKKKIRCTSKQRKKVTLNMEKKLTQIQTSPQLYEMPEDIETNVSSIDRKTVGLKHFYTQPSCLSNVQAKWVNILNKQGYTKQRKHENFFKRDVAQNFRASVE